MPIKSNTELDVTRVQIKRFESAVERPWASSEAADLERRALQSQLDDLREQVVAYETAQLALVSAVARESNMVFDVMIAGGVLTLRFRDAHYPDIRLKLA